MMMQGVTLYGGGGVYPANGDQEIAEDEGVNEGKLPALWWLGVLIALIVIRVAYEMAG